MPSINSKPFEQTDKEVVLITPKKAIQMGLVGGNKTLSNAIIRAYGLKVKERLINAETYTFKLNKHADALTVDLMVVQKKVSKRYINILLANHVKKEIITNCIINPLLKLRLITKKKQIKMFKLGILIADSLKSTLNSKENLDLRKIYPKESYD